MPDLTQPLYPALSVLRAQRHIKQYVLAAHVGISRHRLWMIETGQAKADPELRKRLAAALKVKIDDLGL